MMICGVEDAGRGPVLGPLVMAGCLIDEKQNSYFKDIGVKDSKLLTPRKREELFSKIIDACKGHKIILVPPDEIDGRNGNGLNLNELEAVKAAEIINYLKPDKAIIDCPSNNIKAWKEYVRGHLNIKPELVVEHKADVNHLVVGAASILAKVTRDREVETIKRKIGIDFGSGYLTDPKTQKFMEECFEDHKALFRHNWAPIKKKLEGKGQKKIGEF